MPNEELTDKQKDNLKTIYQELCDSYRAIDDFRAKLLGLLMEDYMLPIGMLIENLILVKKEIQRIDIDI